MAKATPRDSTNGDLVRAIVVQIENAVEIGVRRDDQLVDVFDAFGKVLPRVLLRLGVEEFSANGGER